MTTTRAHHDPGPVAPGPDDPVPDDPVLDDPEVHAEVSAAFARYEQALRDGDVDTLVELFWNDPRCVRYGVADRQHGGEEITAWRRANPSVPPGRVLGDTVVLTIDRSTAVVSTLFGYPGHPAQGRQTQMWVRLPEGWRIVAAHVSETGAPRT